LFTKKSTLFSNFIIPHNALLEGGGAIVIQMKQLIDKTKAQKNALCGEKKSDKKVKIINLEYKH